MPPGDRPISRGHGRPTAWPDGGEAGRHRQANHTSRARNESRRSCPACTSRRACRWKTGRSSCGGSSAASRNTASRTSAIIPSSPNSRSPIPQSRNAYRVRIRGPRVGDNHCSCPDFATNTLGTCKHIEFTLAALERKRGGAAALRAGFQPPYSEVYLQYGARREVRFRPAATARPNWLGRGAIFRTGRGAEAGGLRPFRGSFWPRRAGSSTTCAAATTCWPSSPRCATPSAAGSRWPRRFRAAPQRRLQGPAQGLSLRLPARGRPVRRAGRPLPDRRRDGPGQDHPGHRRRRDHGPPLRRRARADRLPHLAQAPVAARDRTLHRSVGAGHRRPAAAAAPPHSRTEAFFKIINYDTVHADLDLIAAWSPDLVILDEAQRIKNWNTRTARSVKKIAAPYAIVLTGTPLENRLEELISIVQFVDRYRLGPTFRLLHEHQVRDPVGKVVGYSDLDRIGKTLAPILVRRHKDEVLDQLPERIDTNIFVPMTELQRKHHTENMEIVARIVQKWRRYQFLSEADQRRLMIALQRMRMACDSSYLVDHESDHGSKAGRGGRAAGRDVRAAGRQGGGVQPVARHARTAAAAAQGPGVGTRPVPRRRAGAEAQGPGRPLPRRSEMPGVPVHRRGRRGAEPAARLGRAEHGSAVEPGRAGAAHRPGASARPEAAGARGQLRGPGHHRGRHAVGAADSRNRCSPACWTAARRRCSWAAAG